MRQVTGDTMEVAGCVLAEALSDPELRALIDRMAADPAVTREQLFATAFAQGAIHTLEALRQGRIINLGALN